MFQGPSGTSPPRNFSSTPPTPRVSSLVLKPAQKLSGTDSLNRSQVNLSNIALFLNVEYLATVPMFPKYLLFSLLQQENHSNIIHSRCKELEQNMYSSSHLCYHQKYLTKVTEICFAMDFLSKYFDFCIIKTSGIIYLVRNIIIFGYLVMNFFLYTNLLKVHIIFSFHSHYQH